MTDDIVARIRLYANASIDGGWANVFRSDLTAAADEIERLRRDLEVMTEEHRSACLDRDGYLEGNKMLLKALATANETANKYRAEVRRLEADHG